MKTWRNDFSSLLFKAFPPFAQVILFVSYVIKNGLYRGGGGGGGGGKGESITGG